MRLKDQIARAFNEYLRASGCSVPACSCMIHSTLFIPQADYIRVILEPRPSQYPRGGAYRKDGTFVPNK